MYNVGWPNSWLRINWLKINDINLGWKKDCQNISSGIYNHKILSIDFIYLSRNFINYSWQWNECYKSFNVTAQQKIMNSQLSNYPFYLPSKSHTIKQFFLKSYSPHIHLQRSILFWPPIDLPIYPSFKSFIFIQDEWKTGWRIDEIMIAWVMECMR